MPDIPIWPQCNIGCVFCSNPTEGYRETTEQYTYERIVEKIERYRNGEKVFPKFNEVKDYINITGGEPTLHPEFHRVLALFRTEFPRILIRLLSNGRMFSYPQFTERTLKIGYVPFEIAVPIFGYDAKSHESISRTPKSFEQTVAGLENLFSRRNPSQKIEIRMILTKIQMRWLRPTLEFLLKRFPEIDRIVFLFVEFEGFAAAFEDRLRFSIRDCARGLDECYDLLNSFKDTRMYHFPLCAVPNRLWPFVWNTLAPFKVTFTDDCKTACAYKPQCVGIHRGYEKHMGISEFVPIFAQYPNVVLTGDPYHPVARVLGTDEKVAS